MWTINSAWVGVFLLGLVTSIVAIVLNENSRWPALSNTNADVSISHVHTNIEHTCTLRTHAQKNKTQPTLNCFLIFSGNPHRRVDERFQHH